MAKGKKTGGRRAGTPNKVRAECKDNIVAVFHMLNGTDGMFEWAQENKTEFYRMYSKLLPTEITLNEGETAIERLVEQFTDRDIEQAIAALADLGATSKEGAGKAKPAKQPFSVH